MGYPARKSGASLNWLGVIEPRALFPPPHGAPPATRPCSPGGGGEGGEGEGGGGLGGEGGEGDGGEGEGGGGCGGTAASAHMRGCERWAPSAQIWCILELAGGDTPCAFPTPTWRTPRNTPMLTRRRRGGREGRGGRRAGRRGRGGRWRGGRRRRRSRRNCSERTHEGGVSGGQPSAQIWCILELAGGD